MWTKSFSRYTRILLVSAAVIIGAQISISLFESDFRVSIGIFGIFMSLILFGKYPILPVTVISALCVFFSRTLMHWLRFGSWNPQSYFPEMFFYLVYGVLFFLYCRKNDYELSMYSLPWMFLFDYLANITELLTRRGMDAFSFQSQAGVLLVALLRTALAGLLLFCLSHYKFSLLSAEHARRYQNLLLLISELNGEVVLMQKGTRMIEDTMSTAYRLYHDMSERNIDEFLTRTALQIARDVHEIKKDYNLIVRGLSSSMELNSENDGMSLDDILTILKSSLDASLPKGNDFFLIYNWRKIYIHRTIIFCSQSSAIFSTMRLKQQTEIRSSFLSVNPPRILLMLLKLKIMDPELIRRIWNKFLNRVFPQRSITKPARSIGDLDLAW